MLEILVAEHGSAYGCRVYDRVYCFFNTLAFFVLVEMLNVQKLVDVNMIMTKCDQRQISMINGARH